MFNESIWGVSQMLLWVFYDFFLHFHTYFMGDSGEYHGYFMCVSWVVHGCIILFHCCFIGVCFEGVGSLFRGCF